MSAPAMSVPEATHGTEQTTAVYTMGTEVG